MASRARQGKSVGGDRGSTFSVSNLGMYQVEHFIAILNPPEAAILAVGSALQVPVVRDGQVVPGWRMQATSRSTTASATAPKPPASCRRLRPTWRNRSGCCYDFNSIDFKGFLGGEKLR